MLNVHDQAEAHHAKWKTRKQLRRHHTDEAGRLKKFAVVICHLDPTRKPHVEVPEPVRGPGAEPDRQEEQAKR